MTLKQLRCLQEVVRANFSISAAAQALHATQPGLSRQLQLLEQSLGISLFIRRGKRLLSLSPAGLNILLIAERMLLDEENIHESAREQTDNTCGTLTIATTHTQARYALPKVIRRFANEYPQVRLSLRQGTPTEVSNLVLSGNADISIATEPVQLQEGLALLPCNELQRIVLTPARHPLLKSKRLTLEILSKYPLITYDFAFIGRSKIVRAFESAGYTPIVALNAIDADVIKTYVEFGLGVAIIPEIAFDRKRDDALRAIPADHLFEPNVIHVGIRRNHYLRGYVYAFIEMFAPHLKHDLVEKAITEATTR